MIFTKLPPEAFVHFTQTCRSVFHAASESREAVLLHLSLIPGIKVGLQDHSIPTSELFKIFRRRASLNFVGGEQSADCTKFRMQDHTVIAGTSCLTKMVKHFDLSLTLKETGQVLHYQTEDDNVGTYLKWPYRTGRARVLQVVHHLHFVSVLYVWAPGYLCEVCEEILDQNSVGIPILRDSGIPKPLGCECKPREKELEYHLVHHSFYNKLDMEFYRITPPKEIDQGKDCLFPRHLAIHSRLKCAIIWDKLSSSSDHKPRTSSATIMLYAAERCPGLGEVGTYSANQIWPIEKPSNPAINTSEEEEKVRDYLQSFVPRAAAFCFDGRRLKLYAPGMLNPYAVLFTRNLALTCRQLESQVRCTNLLYFNNTTIRVDTPFFGTHARSRSPLGGPSAFTCLLSYLQLGVGPRELSNAPEDPLYIVQSFETVDGEDCNHTVSRDMSLLTQTNSYRRVVAQLRGWSEYWFPNNLTALETIATSKRGTRIALALWDHVLVYTLDPEILIEDWNRGDSANDDDNASQGSNQSANTAQTGTQTVLTTTTGITNPSIVVINDDDDDDDDDPKERYRIDNRAMIKTLRYYDLVEHPDFGEIVELWPVVLKLPDGEIARKMTWTSQNNRKAGSSTEDFKSHPVPAQEIGECSRTVAAPSSHVTSLRYGEPVNDMLQAIDDPVQQNILRLIGLEPVVSDQHGSSNFEPEEELSPYERILAARERANKSIEAQNSATTNDESDVSAETSTEHTNQLQANSQLPRVETTPELGHKRTAEQAFAPTNDAQQDIDTIMQDATPTETNDSTSTILNFEAPLDTMPPPPPRPQRIIISPLIFPSNYNADLPSPAASSLPSPLVADSTSKGKSKATREKTSTRRKETTRPKRNTEDMLTILTDRGVQTWDFGPWAKGRRVEEVFHLGEFNDGSSERW